MYLGSVVEIGPAEALFAGPAHPYTEALLSAIPRTRRTREPARSRILLSGDLPSPLNPPKGCVFSTRCPKVQDRCRAERPVLEAKPDGRAVACHFA